MIRAAFLRRMASAALACALLDLTPVAGATWAAPQEYAILHGDGVHDDTRAIQALMNGEQVWDAREGGVLGGVGPILIRDGTYRMEGTVYVPLNPQACFESCRFEGDWHSEGPIFRLHPETMHMVVPLISNSYLTRA